MSTSRRPTLHCQNLYKSWTPTHDYIHPAMWRDRIRRQYDCRSLVLTIRGLRLRYVPEEDADEEQITNLLEEDWRSVKSTSEKLPSNEITALLVLRQLEEGEELWERRDSPSYIISLEHDHGLKVNRSGGFQCWH